MQHEEGEYPVMDSSSALKNIADDEILYREIVELFLETTPDLLKEMDEAIKTGEKTLLLRKAHSLKSTARTVGAMRLGNCAKDIELLIKNGSSNYDSFVQNVTDNYNLFVVEAEKYLKKS